MKVRLVFDFEKVIWTKTSFHFLLMLQLSPFLEDKSLDDHHQLHSRLLVVKLAALLYEAGDVSLGGVRGRRRWQRASP